MIKLIRSNPPEKLTEEVQKKIKQKNLKKIRKKEFGIKHILKKLF